MYSDYSDYSKMTKEQKQERSRKLFDILDNQGVKMTWFAKFCGVQKQTVSTWRSQGAPIYAMRIIDYMVGKGG